ncbi:hypothetical protein ACFL6M_04265 [Candidatus Eisenbacteria bacterium]|uniref:PAS domain-containing protein n=1 Tax=Eiseniibacteriota bacterium TaxID=2212470 RepID=A0ABV6YKV1_UNCEI
MAKSELLTSGGVKMNPVDSLRASEERLRLVLEASNVGVFGLDFQTDGADFSPEQFTMLGYAADELPHTKAGGFECIN